MKQKWIKNIQDRLIEIRQHEDTPYNIELELSEVITSLDSIKKPKRSRWRSADERPKHPGEYFVERYDGIRVVAFWESGYGQWTRNDSEVFIDKWRKLG